MTFDWHAPSTVCKSICAEVLDDDEGWHISHTESGPGPGPASPLRKLFAVLTVWVGGALACVALALPVPSESCWLC